MTGRVTGRGWLAGLVLALPVAGALASVVTSELARRGATEWRIPITGYDPRDPLRGRYVSFQYAWQVAGPRRVCDANACLVCLEGNGERARLLPRGTACRAGVDPGRSGLFPIRGETDGQVTAATRIWVSETRAPELEQQLRTRPMVAVARLLPGGRLVPERLEPR